jgi:hypothetical protein
MKSSSLSRSIPWVLSIFFVLILLPRFKYPFSWPYDTFESNSLIHAVYWFALAVLFLAAVLSYALRVKLSPPPRYVLMFVVVLLALLASFFIQGWSLSRVNEQQETIVFALSWQEEGMKLGGTLFDLLLAFSFLFLWPYGKKDPKNQDLLLLLCLTLALASAIYGYLENSVNPLSGADYPYHHSFFASDEEYGKILFVGFASALFLAYSKRGVYQFLFALLAVFLLVAMASQALALAFWASALALAFFAFAILFSSSSRSFSKIASGIYLCALLTLGFLVVLPSATSSLLAPYLQNSFFNLYHSHALRWAHYLQALQGPSALLGEGLLGFYRDGFLNQGSVQLQALQNGFLDAFNTGGVFYLFFYLLLILVGFAALRKEEGQDPLFFALLASFSMIFLLLSVFSDERLLLSVHVPSFVMSYLFSCYHALHKKKMA